MIYTRIYRFKVKYADGQAGELYVEALCEKKAEGKLKDVLEIRERIGLGSFTWGRPELYMKDVIC